MFKLIVFAIILGSSNFLNICDNWIQYKDLKCFKVLEKKGTEEEAVGNCTQLEQKSTLITIHSKEEQEFLNNILNKYNNISQNSWIGIKYLDKTYKWVDNSVNNYTNWSEDAVKDGTDQCAQMSLSGTGSGNWIDVSCKKPALIVCQKSQEISLNSLKKMIENQEKKMTYLENNLVPIGFIYTQFPNTSTPQQLWPQFKWLEVTKEYSGLFFRAEGEESLAFGQIQSQNQSWISNVYLKGGYYDSWKGYHVHDYHTSLNQTKMIETNPENIHLAVRNLEFYTTFGEVRPKNTAIKIFKRIE